MRSVIGGGSDRLPLLEHLVNLVTTVAPTIRELGLASAERRDRGILLEQMIEETTGAVVVSRPQVG